MAVEQVQVLVALVAFFCLLIGGCIGLMVADWHERRRWRRSRWGRERYVGVRRRGRRGRKLEPSADGEGL